MVTLYGLKACDTCRKARKELENAGKSVDFVDVRETPLNAENRRSFAASLGDALINKRSTTWREMSESDRSGPPESLIECFPTVMKRPVIVSEKGMSLGWDKTAKALHLGTSGSAS